ncbi:ATP-binding cassette domain-containing protein [Spiroplasma culicicola]|uniref:ABC transporter domain-containing protein n=1 Tax=Spiroplasma culicicola AES-1 TaxID=1276246 RepID=W6A7K0_9MOLU|nr:ATP-binding cassette domain-containing protein [Spiroplasma culicicola]AHI52962.1 hypothetical protein SCULI_v1c06210 [Spiroplasma culicicola AES-1]
MKNLSKNIKQKPDAISIVDLNKQFKSGYGIKDINFLVKRGAVFGYLGPNGAGKSTTIRTIMGFIKPNSGQSNVFIKTKNEANIEEIISYDSWTDSNKIQKTIGYVPGEIAFPENMTGIELLKMVFKLRNMSDWEDVKKYIYYWEFDPSLKIKKMSKGMKQKLALCIAWMHNPDIIILDEPTTGLDPLMQEKFANLVKESKKQGKAIILSSHIFSEIERTCDYVSIVKRGEIISTINIEDIQYNDEKTYEIKFKDEVPKEILNSKNWTINSNENNVVFLVVKNEQINELLTLVSKFKIEFLKEHPLDLEQYFMKYYQNEIKKDVIDNIEKHNEKQKEIKGNSKVIFEIVKRSYKSMIMMWSFLTAITLIMIVAMLVTMKVNGYFIPSPDPNTGFILPVEDHVNGIVQQIIGDMLFGSIGYVLMIIFVLMNATKIVASEIETGTMVNLLTTNLTRKSVILTKMLTFISLIFTAILAQFVVTLITLQAVGQLQYVSLDLLAIKAFGAFLLLFFTAAIAFIFSTYFNRGAQSLGVSGAIVIISWVFQIASGFDALDWMKYFSINSLLDLGNLTDLNKLSVYLGQYIFMSLAGIGIFIGSYFVFTKKDLPL